MGNRKQVHGSAAPATGRIIGRYFAYAASCESLPAEAMFLPEGCEKRIEEGKFIRLFTCGIREGNRLLEPEPAAMQEVIMEAGDDGILLRGPAVFATHEAPEVSLGRVVDDAVALASVHELQSKVLRMADYRLARNGLLVAAGSTVTGMMISLISMLLRGQVPPVMTAFVLFWFILTFGFWVMRATELSCLASARKRLWDELPARFKTGEAAEDMLRVDHRLGPASRLVLTPPTASQANRVLTVELLDALGRFQDMDSANFTPPMPNIRKEHHAAQA